MKKLFTILFFLGIILTKNSYSQAGTLDSLFGVNGLAAIDGSSNGAAICKQIHSLSNGQYLGTGYINESGTVRFAMVKFNNDGSFDTNFGVNGISKSVINGSTAAYSYASAILPNGKIIMGGDYYDGSGFRFTVAQFNDDGTPDLNFGNNGSNSYPAGSPVSNYGYGLSVQSTGKIIVSGAALFGNNDFSMVRFNSDGSVDSTFGTNGLVHTPIGSGSDNAYAITLTATDEIILVGDIEISGTYVFTAAKYNSNGVLDAGFGTLGIATYAIGTADDDYGYSVAMQTDGKIVIGGAAKGLSNFSDYEFTLLRLNEDGTKDTTFGDDGFSLYNFGTSFPDDYGSCVAIQSDGKIVLAGRTFVAGSSIGLARFLPDGTIDSTFGINGNYHLSLGNAQHHVNAMTIDNNNKILISADALVSYPCKINFLRFNNDIGSNVNEVEENSLEVFPNPSTGKFQIANMRNEKIDNISIYSIEGKLSYSQKPENSVLNDIDVKLTPGFYLLKVTLNEKIICKSILVQ